LWFHQEKVEKKEMGGDGKVFTFEEVTVHNNHKDCWLIINGKVRSFIEFSCFSLQRFVLSGSFVDFMV
jgi:helix-turn-helix protein